MTSAQASSAQASSGPRRRSWAELPRETREAVEAHVGPVTEVERIEIGERSDIASVLEAPGGRIFAKGVPADDRQAPWLDNEARINPYVAGLAPRLLCRVLAGGWLVLGFEHVAGRHADYSPGSADLVKLAAALTALEDLPCPDVVSRRIEGRWPELADRPHAVTGDALVHADLNPGNVLVTEDRAYLLDWAGACRGAAWTEPAMLVPRLIAHGHSPGDAEAWAAQFGSWRHVTAQALGTLAAAESDRWDRVAAQWPYPRIVRTAAAARTWRDWRLARR
ncbi:phosphotransferase [Actinomadura miaoliensis]|uniref:Aminoglycoside phosphotransferase domain-containing protein n=1 Tax=Actinomadura miaoliensis TaxID=430685 RepID=A0ABP7V6K8_9ACTN